jgi:hypothetical protein
MLLSMMQTSLATEMTGQGRNLLVTMQELFVEQPRAPRLRDPQAWAYPPSWLDRFFEQIERLPGPGLFVYMVLIVLLPLVHAAIKWSDGSYPVGTLCAFHVVVTSSGVWFLALTHYLNWAAHRSMHNFQSALACDAADCDALTYRLTTLPARPTLLVTMSGILFGLLVVIGVDRGVIFDPAVLVFTSPVAFWFESVVAIFVCTSFLLLVYHTIHQVRMVNQIYTTVTKIDLFNLTPIHAFSVLTAQTATGALPIAYAWVATEPSVANDKVSVLAVISLVVLALITFLWPLLGIHQVLEDEKSKAQAEVSQRIKRMSAELHRRIDETLGMEVDAPIKAMNGLKQELDYLDKISTWPWQPDTIRALVTAILLPVALWFITRLLERFINL